MIFNRLLLQMLARHERGKRLVDDMRRRMRLMREEMERVTAEHAKLPEGRRSAQEFADLEAELKKVREDRACG